MASTLRHRGSLSALAGTLAVLMTGSVAMGGTVLGTYTFHHIKPTPNSGAAGVAAVESQVRMDLMTVTDGSNNLVSDQVDFKFYFSSFATAMSVTGLHWDDGTLLGMSSIVDSGADVAFSQMTGQNVVLPDGNLVNFHTSAAFSATADNPVSHNGLDALADWVTVRFNLINGKTANDTLAALALGATDSAHDLDGGLRVGLHVQSIAPSGASDAFVNSGLLQSIPLPAPVAIAGSGLAMLGLCVRRRVARSK